ncbi:MAG: hypothetical protein IJM34_04735 [Lachnospiraceae bacterium]|jgi:light-regulated signal transduction histidine kinase (bacteriophytochrome)|nr:hypothetical protein [Lachnospiraceae bacterium]
MDSWIFLIFFIMHSIFLILFSYLCYRNPKEEDTVDTDAIIASLNNELRRLKDEASEKDAELNTLKEQVASITFEKSANDEETVRLKAELEELKAAPEVQESDPSSILPQNLSKRSESSTVNIIEVAKSVAREFHDAAAKAGLTINISSVDENLLVKADQNLLRILFRNIVDNSIKYMGRHGSLIITVSAVGDDIFVVLKDTGDGLSADETKHIFELNYQGSNRISGNGLGLYQAKAIVEYYGGTIYAKSNAGKGMGVYIQLPTT